MRTKLFFFAMLAGVAASAQVTHVEPVSANYANKTVSFRMWWNAGSRDATHLSKVWVWVDYITVNSNNTTAGNAWTRATVSSASPTISVSYDGSNRQGFWLQGNSGSYSATVTVQLNITASKFNWCAYVSDYPPNVTATNGTYTFKGTPPFTLTTSNGTIQTVNGTTLATSALTVTPTTIRDKTACPSVFCPYQGNDLLIDASHLCQQRTSGAKNWEAYIKDSRDNTIYRITQFSDNSWWMAEDMTNADKRISTCGGFSWYSTRNKPACPNGWSLPTISQLVNRFTSLNDTYGADLICGSFHSAVHQFCNPYSCFALYMSSGCDNCWFWGSGGENMWCGANETTPGDCSSTYYLTGRVRCYRIL